MAELDLFDVRILEALQDNARITMLDLAERVGLSPTPCARRVKRLEDDGLIDRYVTLLNGERLGIGLHAFVNIRLRNQTRKSIDIFEAAIREMPEVTECYLVSGNYDYLLHIRVRDIDAFRDVVRNRLTVIESVGETHTSIALEQTKYTTALAIPATEPHR